MKYSLNGTPLFNGLINYKYQINSSWTVPLIKPKSVFCEKWGEKGLNFVSKESMKYLLIQVCYSCPRDVSRKTVVINGVVK